MYIVLYIQQYSMYGTKCRCLEGGGYCYLQLITLSGVPFRYSKDLVFLVASWHARGGGHQRLLCFCTVL